MNGINYRTNIRFIILTRTYVRDILNKRKCLSLQRRWRTSTIDTFNTYTQIHIRKNRYEFENEQKCSKIFYHVIFDVVK